jgi:hypothetical protein
MSTTEISTTSSEHASSLIRTIRFGDNIIETPAPGRWSISAGQPVVIHRRTGRHRRGEGHTICGDLVMTDHLPASTIEFAMRGWTSHHADSTLHFAGRFDSVDGLGRWYFRGRFTSDFAVVDDAVVPVSYRGVYNRGTYPVAWIAIDARVDLPKRFGLRRSYVAWLSDLNISAPSVEP